MSTLEYAAMLATGQVQESFSGTTYLACPADATAYLLASTLARPGSCYIEFDIPVHCVKVTSRGWAKVIGPHSLEARVAMRNGAPLPQMPAACAIAHVACLME